jgi:hypothetical protein
VFPWSQFAAQQHTDPISNQGVSVETSFSRVFAHSV